MLFAQSVRTAASEHSNVCNDDSLQPTVKRDGLFLKNCFLGGFLNALTGKTHCSKEKRGRSKSTQLGQQRGLQITIHGRWSQLLASGVPSIFFSSLGPFTPKGMKARQNLLHSRCFVMSAGFHFYLNMFLHLNTSTSVRATDDNQITL